MSAQEDQILTVILSPIAFITGYIGLHLTEIDLLMAIILKALSMISVICIILVNWSKAISQIKRFFK